MAWRMAKALEQLRKEINGVYPDRDRSADGGVGDTSHGARKSDHNPNAAGVVRARDFDEDLTPGGNRQQLEPLVDHLVSLGRKGDRRLNPDGYVIYEGRIWSAAKGWVERAYTGANAHDHHAHVSVTTNASGYDNPNPWGVADLLARKPKKPVRRDRWLGLTNPPMSGGDVADVERALVKAGNRSLPVDGVYRAEDAAIVRRFQENRQIEERGVGPLTWQALREVAHG